MQACMNPVNPEWPWNSAIKWTKISSKTSGSPDKAALPGGAGFSGQSTHLPGSGLLPGEPASMNAHSRTLKHRAVSQPTYCAWTLGGETQLPGRPLDLNNKTPMRSCEGTENGRWTSPIEGRGLHLLLNRVAAVSWYVRLALVLKFLCWIFHY